MDDFLVARGFFFFFLPLVKKVLLWNNILNISDRRDLLVLFLGLIIAFPDLFQVFTELENIGCLLVPVIKLLVTRNRSPIFISHDDHYYFRVGAILVVERMVMCHADALRVVFLNKLHEPDMVSFCYNFMEFGVSVPFAPSTIDHDELAIFGGPL